MFNMFMSGWLYAFALHIIGDMLKGVSLKLDILFLVIFLILGAVNLICGIKDYKMVKRIAFLDGELSANLKMLDENNKKEKTHEG